MVEQKAKLQQQEAESKQAESKRAEKTRMAAPKCATENKIRHLCRTKILTYNNLKRNRR